MSDSYYQESTLKTMRAVRDVLAERHPMTVRQVYYQMVVLGIVENNAKQYNHVQGVIKSAREDALADSYGVRIPYEWITDHSRHYDGGFTGWSSVQRYFDYRKDSFARGYYRNPWEGQKYYVEVWVEKDAMDSTLEAVVQELPFNDIPVNCARGYSSLSLLYDASERFKREEAAGRMVVVLYFGDFDPSGEDMVPSPHAEDVEGSVFVMGDMRKRLRELGCRNTVVMKMALTAKQFTEWFVTDGPDRLPLNPNPIKESDARARAFRDRYGERGAELDAVPLERFREILEKSVNELIDSEAYEQVIEKQDKERERLAAALEGLTFEADDDGEAEGDEDE